MCQKPAVTMCQDYGTSFFSFFLLTGRCFLGILWNYERRDGLWGLRRLELEVKFKIHQMDWKQTYRQRCLPHLKNIMQCQCSMILPKFTLTEFMNAIDTMLKCFLYVFEMLQHEIWICWCNFDVEAQTSETNLLFLKIAFHPVVK